MSKTVPEMLRECADVYEQRNALYKDNYKRIGGILRILFSDGFKLETDADFNRMATFVQIVGKITRYAAQFNNGGHDDSLLDNSVYSQMLRELDAEERGREKEVSPKQPGPKESLSTLTGVPRTINPTPQEIATFMQRRIKQAAADNKPVEE